MSALVTSQRGRAPLVPPALLAFAVALLPAPRLAPAGEFSCCQEHTLQTGGAGQSLRHASLTDPECRSAWSQRLAWGAQENKTLFFLDITHCSHEAHKPSLITNFAWLLSLLP